MRCWILSAIFGLVSIMLAQNSAYQPDPNWRVPQDAAMKPNPLACKPDAAVGGKKLFSEIARNVMVRTALAW